MTPIYLEIFTTSPVLLADGPPAGNLTNTLDYVPGSVLLGVLAQRYLEQPAKSASDPAFQRLFLEGDAIFDNAYIDGAQPIPRSARSCKYFDGFEGEDNAHGVSDLVLNPGDELRCRYAICNKPVDYIHGYYCPATRPSIPAGWRQAKVHKRVITRTAISGPFGTASTGRLYSQEVVEEGQTFYARIQVEADLADELSALVTEPFGACIGRASSRGQGWVTLKQCDRFGPILDAAARRAPQFKDRQGQPLLAVTLLSDAIFSDDFLRDVTMPDIRHITAAEPFLGLWESSPCEAFADTRLVAGFQGPPWNLPREPRLSVKAGSVIVFKAKTMDAAINNSTHSGEVRIGERIAEGFGRAVLWHRFHLDFRPQ